MATSPAGTYFDTRPIQSVVIVDGSGSILGVLGGPGTNPIPTLPGIPATPTNGDTGAMSDTAPHTFVGAQGVGKKFYCTMLVVSNSSATGTEVAITGLDSGTTFHVPAAASFGGAVLVFNPPLIFGANTAAQATCSITATNTFVSANGYTV